MFSRLRDGEEMPLICPTSQGAFSNAGGRLLLCMGLFSIFWNYGDGVDGSPQMDCDNDHLGTSMPVGAPSTPSP
jgi:hypothetical protein